MRLDLRLFPFHVRTSPHRRPIFASATIPVRKKEQVFYTITLYVLQSLIKLTQYLQKFSSVAVAVQLVAA